MALVFSNTIPAPCNPESGDFQRSPFRAKAGYRRLVRLLLLFFALLLGTASPALAEEKFCSQYGGVIDGNVDPVPTQITIDTDCTFQNWPQSNPLTTTINFQTNDPSIYLIVFDNVYFTGHMACASVDHRIWFANGSDYGSGNACQDLFIPVESIDKRNPAGRSTAAIGVPFTYTLTLPSMTDVGGPSANDLHSVVISDDLTATGADLILAGPPRVVWESDGTAVPHIFSDGGTGKNLSIEFPAGFVIPNGRQIVIEIAVVLEDTPGNWVGKTFTNTAKWWFGRLIDGTFYEPLPGEWGVTEPLAIAGPDLVVMKTSDETALNVTDTAAFTIDVENIGGSDAWHATILDQLPAGMCASDPTATLGARIAAADGTPVAGLLPGTDYSVAYSGCQLSLSMLTDKARIAPEQHLLITYLTQLDPGFTDDGATLTNVAGATGWASSDGSFPSRTFTRTLTDGTPGILDHEDSQTVTAALHGYYFEKTVENLTSHASFASTAAPGDRLRYRLRLFNVDQTIEGIRITDPLDLNAFDPATFAMVTLPAGAAHNFHPVTGLLQISGGGDPLNVAVAEELVIEFEITLRPDLANGTIVANQASLSANGGFSALSDDPYLNGVASPDVAGDEDPTRVEIQTPGPLGKGNIQASAAIGEQLTYRLTVPAVPAAEPLYDVRILDNLGLAAADLRFVRASVVSGGAWTLANTSGSNTDLVIEDTATGIDIPANGQAVIELTVELLNTAGNNSGLLFTNTASYTYNRANGIDATRSVGEAGSTLPMTVVEPDLTAVKTVRFAAPAGKPATEPAMAGDVLEYEIAILNSGTSPAFDAAIVDTLPANLSLIPASAIAQINGAAVAGFAADPTVLPGGGLAWGRGNSDGSLDIPTGQSLVLTYQAAVAAVAGEPINNSVYVDWTSLDGGSLAERTGAGCPATTAPNDYCSGPASAAVGTLDNTFITKAVVEDSFAETPASTADPIVRVGDTVTYELTLHLQEYTTRSVAVEDALPGGLALESFTIEGGASFSYALAAQPAAGDTGTLRWELGDITNQPSNDNTPIDDLVIRYVAKVVADSQPAGVGHLPSILRDNLASLSYTGGDPAVDPGRLTAAARVDVRQPQMGAISKVDLGSGRAGTGTLADPYQVNVATDVMEFRLSSCNEGLAPAYGLVITDLLAPELNENDLAAHPPVVKIGAATLAGGADYVYSAPGRGGEMRIALLDRAPVQPAECITVDYQIGFHADLTVSKSWSNRARLAEYRSLPLSAQGRLYQPNDLAQVWMTNLVSPEQLLKTLVSPASGEATVGEEVVYRITVPAAPMNAALGQVVVTDLLHGALEYLGASGVDTNGSPVALTETVASGQVNLGIAHIPAGQQAIITLRARVANNGQANGGTSFANTASYSYAGMPDGLATASASGPLSIVEPLVTVSKTASATSPRAGDLLTCTLTLAAAGAGVGDIYSPAFDLAIEENLGLGLAYEPGSATVNGAALADPLTNGGDGVTAVQTLAWSPATGIDLDLAEGAAATVAYQVRVLESAAPGQALTSSAIGRWTGLNGDQSAVERTGSGTPEVNDYFTQPAALTLTTQLAVSLVKSVVNATTGEDPGANARPGDTLRYTIVLANESLVPVSNVSVVDELAAQFVPGSLQVLSVTDGNADSTNSTATGGVNGTGMVEVRNLALAPQGDPGGGDTLTIVFTATLAPAIDSGTLVLNQAQLSAPGLSPASSNQTATLISSAPVFQVWKTSQDLTGDTSVLMAGDGLRYTLAVKNIGNEDAAGVRLRDQIPDYTTYVANSTTLNGASIADPGAGVSPLENGMLINGPADATPGAMHADAAGTAAHKATITFTVVINPDVLDGTIISNQGFLNGSGAGSGPFSDQPSDDPSTPVLDDPTRDIVGNLPLVDAAKTVSIQVDHGTPGVVDPGDVLRYTIVISNSGAAPATGVILTDAIPASTAYAADSVRLNGAPVGQPDGGVSPLVAGIPVSSGGSASGTIAAGAQAMITFDVQVDAGAAAGTLISNQGYVASMELATEPTDADGNDANGDQPTIVVVGSGQQIMITKEVLVVGGGAAQAGGQLDFVVRATNIGVNPATQVVLTDDLNPLAGQVSYVAGSATLNGSTAGVSDAGGMLTGAYGAAYGDLPSGATATLRFRVLIDGGLPIGTTITNTGRVEWSTPTLTATSSASVDVGGIPGAAMLTGQAWHDANFDNLPDNSELPLADWQVAVFRNGMQIGATTTDAGGLYGFSGLAPTAAGDRYELRFSAPGAGASTAKLGLADSAFTNGVQQISGITADSGSNLQNLNLPIDPNGVVFNSILRTPVAGATLTLLHNGAPAASSCFDDPAQQNQVTLASGYYKFDLNFSDATCPSGGGYAIRVTPPGSGYMAGPSRVIAPGSNDPELDNAAAPYSVPLCPDDAVATPAGYCEAMPGESAPGISMLPGSVVHHLYLTLSTPVPGASQMFNNHIPVDPELHGAVAITKTSSMLNVTKGQLVPYTITVHNVLGVPLYDMGIVDRFPAGFKYVQGSARLDGVPREPEATGQTLLWDDLTLQVNDKHTLQLLLVVGAGVSEGDYVNWAHVLNTATGGRVSEEAAATVRVVPDPTFDCTDVIGKVFDDRDLNGRQDPGEEGLAGARVVTARGLIGTTDEHGRFHITCAVVPDEDRGSNFILKLDDRSLPTGYRVTTENPRVQHATRGKALRINFGAAIHRVVSMDIADGVFEPETTELRLQWEPKIGQLLHELQKSPSVLRLSYLADVEPEGLVRKRLEALKKEIANQWRGPGGGYRLTIETEVFWRRGGPPARIL